MEELEKLASKKEIDFKLVFESSQRTWYITLFEMGTTYQYISKSYSDLNDIIELAIIEIKGK